MSPELEELDELELEDELLEDELLDELLDDELLELEDELLDGCGLGLFPPHAARLLASSAMQPSRPMADARVW